MSTQLKILITVVVITIFFVPNGVSEISNNMNTTAGSDHKYGFLKLVRKPRETIVGNGCPKGRFLYYGKCKSFKEIRMSDYDYIDIYDKTITPKTTVREGKVETIGSDINLSVIPLSRPDIITEPSSDVKTLEVVEKSSILVTELNLTVPIQIPEGTALKPDVSDSSHATTGPSQSAATELVTVMTESGSTNTEFAPTMGKPKNPQTDDKLILEDTSNRGSTVIAYSTSVTMWPKTFSNSESEPAFSQTDTETTVTESDYITTDVPSKGIPDIIVQNDQKSTTLFQIELFLFITMLVVFCVAIFMWIFEQLYVIFYRRKAEENLGQYMSKEVESLV